MPRLPLVDAAQLDLFDVAAISSAPIAADAALSSSTASRSSPAGTPAAAPVASAVPPTDQMRTASWRHPRATHEARLNGHTVAYELRRARRKSIGFIIGTDGLVVSAPRWVGRADVDTALQEKARWILTKLQEQDDRARRLAQAKVEWRDGTTIPFLGESVIVVLDTRSTGAVLHTAPDTLPGVPRLTLHVGLPQSAAPEQIRDAVQSWLQRQAKRIFEERCRHFATQLGVRMTRLSLSSATTRWGSAGADGAIRLHWRLVHFAMPTIDYVVAHELAHLREMNHSAAFWEVVRSVVPDYERARGTLRDDVLPVFD
jgi:predicted metal-dependent hydrolase